MHFLTSSDKLLDLLYLFPKKLARYILRKKAKVFLNEILENLSMNENMPDVFFAKGIMLLFKITIFSLIKLETWRM